MANFGCALCLHAYDGESGICSITNIPSDKIERVCNERLPVIDAAIRYKELLNAFINNLSVAESNHTVLKYLLHLGFTRDELIHKFNYSEEDVKDAEKEMDDYTDTLGFL